MDLPQQTAGDLMHPGVTCVQSTQTIVEAAKLMASEGVGALPICGEEGKLVGMLTDRDIVVKCIAADEDPNTCTAGEHAEGHVIWVSHDAPAGEVLSRMEEHQIRRLPVIGSDKQLVGIICQADIARSLGEREVGELVGAVSMGPGQT